jgi:hypothetical protein
MARIFKIATIKIALPLVAALSLPLFATAVSAQNVDSIRAQCLADAQAAYPGSDPGRDMYGNARKEVYITCMRKHGLTP